ncbi:CARDB domain-containing protein [Shimia sp. R9_3]|uniref:CARDB domain-containing protein n=1 Tax=Shimia sp. R9_3 TaxID=2821113 RepID=UPI001ADA54E8|nr:CARDB domain-containing protein [Shimia sp. R9_3]MBO9403086.1 hypothetical protein [Shimia sp. R9_3]
MSVDISFNRFATNSYFHSGVYNDDLRGQLTFTIVNDGDEATTVAAGYKITALAPDGSELGVVKQGRLSGIASGESEIIREYFYHKEIYAQHPELVGQTLSYRVDLDSENTISESDESNNSLVIQGQPLIEIAPDYAFDTRYGYMNSFVGSVHNDDYTGGIRFAYKNDDVGSMGEGASYTVTAVAPDGRALGVVATGSLRALDPGKTGSVQKSFSHKEIYDNHPDLVGQKIDYRVSLDSASIIDETNESNNELLIRGQDLPEIAPDYAFDTRYGYMNSFVGSVHNDDYTGGIRFAYKNDDVGSMGEGASYTVTAVAPDGRALGVVATGSLRALDPGKTGSVQKSFSHKEIYDNHPDLVGQKIDYRVSLDSASIIDETNESNNELLIRGQDLPEIAPDYAFDTRYGYMNSFHTTNRDGEYTANVRFTYKNDDVGSMESGASYTITAYGPDGAELVVVASGPLSALAPGKNAQVRTSFNHDEIYKNYPELIGEEITYKVRLDSGDEIYETDETNNEMVFVGGPLPVPPVDLAVKDVELSAAAILDGKLNTSLYFDYSIDGLLGLHGDITYKVEMIPPGQSSGTVISSGQIEAPLGDSSGTITIPDAAAAIYNGGGALDETYRFRVTIDPENTIDETNENNNTGETSLFAPLIKPDAYVTEVDAEGDDTFVFKASLGGNDILSAPVEYQIVASAEKGGPILVLDSGDTTLFAGGDMQVIRLNDVDDALAAAGGNPATDKYILTAILDQNAKLDEFNEFNNFGSEVFDFV